MSALMRLRDWPQMRAALIRARKERGLTQDRLAAILHVGPSTISHREKGLRGLSATDLFATAQALGYDLALLPREEPTDG